MQIQSIRPANRVLLSALIGISAGTAASCTQARSTAPARLSSPHGLDSRGQSNSASVLASEKALSAVRTWFEEVFAADRAERIPIQRYVDLAGGPEILRGCGMSPEAYVYCSGFTKTEICLVISAGRRAIPLLMDHVRDYRKTCCAFTHPLSSRAGMRAWRVGEVACYMIEAVLRQCPYFTWTGRLLYLPPAKLSAEEKARYVLGRAASAYEQWYHRCFDEKTESVICHPDDLPHVAWEYDYSEGKCGW